MKATNHSEKTAGWRWIGGLLCIGDFRQRLFGGFGGNLAQLFPEFFGEQAALLLFTDIPPFGTWAALADATPHSRAPWLRAGAAGADLCIYR